MIGADGAVADALADALARGAAPGDAIRAALDNQPWKCVACVVGHGFYDLAVANFGLADLACEACSCGALGETACVRLVQVSLYAAIAALPFIALDVWKDCGAFCAANATVAADPPALEIPECPRVATFGDYEVSNVAGAVPARQATAGTICWDAAGLAVSVDAVDADVFSDPGSCAEPNPMRLQPELCASS